MKALHSIDELDPDLRFRRYNFQREEDLDAFGEILDSGEGEVVLLAGEPGIGRRYLIDAACYLHSGPTLVLPLNLSNFEPGEELGSFIERETLSVPGLDEKARARTKTFLGEFFDALGILEQTFFHTPIVSLAVRAAKGIDCLQPFLERERSGGAKGAPEELARALLRDLSRDYRLVVHVEDVDDPSIDQLRWLLVQASLQSFVLAASCEPSQSEDEIVPLSPIPPRRVELEPLDLHELQDALDRCFSPNEFPWQFIRALVTEDRGEPGRVARRMLSLVSTDGIVEEASRWKLPPQGMDSPRVANAFVEDIYMPVYEVLDLLREEHGDIPFRFVRLAALCGEIVPAEMIFAFLDLDEEGRDQLIDVIDDWLGEDSEAFILVDLGYGFPGLPGCVYRFRHPLVHRAILASGQAFQGTEVAGELLQFARALLPPGSRAAMKVHGNLMLYAQQPEAREQMRQEMKWWFDPRAAREFTEALRGADVDSSMVLNFLQARMTRWSPYRLLAILDALIEIPQSLLSQALSLRGVLLYYLARFDEAEPLLRRALSISESSYGADHPQVAADLNNLAVLLRDTNRLSEVEPLFRRALSISESSYGADHPQVAMGLNNLAALLKGTSRLSEAEPLYRRALSISESSYGADHPQVATGLNNLAALLKDTNRLSEAEPLLRRALSISESSYGADHPEVAISLNNLALLLQDTNRLSEAEPLLRRALSIRESSYGADHPEVAISLNNLATLLKGTNRLSEAEPLYRRALSISASSYGADHPQVAADLNNLAVLLRDTNRLSEVEPLFRRALSISESSYGVDHPQVAKGLNNLAMLLQETDRQREAGPLLHRAVRILMASFGPDHSLTKGVEANLRAVLVAIQNED
ncbi:MAG: tetratricopeptide repeat protein [Acidobacteriota bacterium]